MRPDVDGHLDRVLLATAKRFKLERFALRALLEATRLLGLVMAEWLRERRDSGEPVQELASSVKLQAYLLTVAQETIELLGARWEKVPPRQRPHYGPEQRYRILRIKTELGLSASETARRFRVSADSVERWQQEARAHPDCETVGSLVKPEPPVRRFADVVRHLIQQMAASGFGGSEMIAKVLTRAGWRMSKRSVGRVRKERPAPKPSSDPEPLEQDRDRSVVARYPGHVLSLDLTDIPALFRIAAFKLVLVIDLWSRMPLAARLFPGDPTAAEVTGLFTDASRRVGGARHVVTDHGVQFTSDAFGAAVAATSTRHRFGAVGKYGSIAVIERCWRTLKYLLRVRLQPAVVLEDYQRRIEVVLLYFAYHRPHRGLGGATPAEVFLGLRPAHLDAASPPRGRSGEVADEAPFQIVQLDPELRLPLLLPRVA